MGRYGHCRRRSSLSMIRLGAPLPPTEQTPAEWAQAVLRAGYRADFCPVDEAADDATVQAYATAAAASDIVIAEVGAWSNPLSPDPAVRSQAIDYCRSRLDLAERIGASCCVNIAGSRGEKWDGPTAADYAPDTFDLIVETVRAIIDEVQPRRTFYTLETMPWMLPDSAESYLQLLHAIDRPAFGVHLDPVNLINSPRRYFQQDALFDECFSLLGPYIKSCHAKDIVLRQELTTQLVEAIPGQGGFDYAYFLRKLHALDRDVPLMLEHLQHQADYDRGARHIRAVAAAAGIPLA